GGFQNNFAVVDASPNQQTLFRIRGAHDIRHNDPKGTACAEVKFRKIDIITDPFWIAVAHYVFICGVVFQVVAGCEDVPSRDSDDAARIGITWIGTADAAARAVWTPEIMTFFVGQDFRGAAGIVPSDRCWESDVTQTRDTARVSDIHGAEVVAVRDAVSRSFRAKFAQHRIPSGAVARERCSARSKGRADNDVNCIGHWVETLGQVEPAFLRAGWGRNGAGARSRF